MVNISEMGKKIVALFTTEGVEAPFVKKINGVFETEHGKVEYELNLFCEKFSVADSDKADFVLSVNVADNSHMMFNKHKINILKLEKCLLKKQGNIVTVMIPELMELEYDKDIIWVQFDELRLEEKDNTQTAKIKNMTVYFGEKGKLNVDNNCIKVNRLEYDFSTRKYTVDAVCNSIKTDKVRFMKEYLPFKAKTDDGIDAKIVGYGILNLKKYKDNIFDGEIDIDNIKGKANGISVGINTAHLLVSLADRVLKIASIDLDIVVKALFVFKKKGKFQNLNDISLNHIDWKEIKRDLEAKRVSD